MKDWTVKALLAATGGQGYHLDDILEKEIGGVELDSRSIKPGDVFIAVKGERVDGHDYIVKSLTQGALLAIGEKEPEENIPYILVKDSLKALRDAAKAYRLLSNIPIIGITGSVGKTSTKELTASVLSQGYSVLKTEGNLNNEIGLPEMVLRIRPEHEIAVLEMGINHFGEMERLSEIARPDIVIITSIGECHLEALHDLDGVLKAKTEIFRHMNPKGLVLLNGDDGKLQSVKEVHGRSPLFYGLETILPAKTVQKAALQLRELQKSPKIEDFDDSIFYDINPAEFIQAVPFPGIHQQRNAMAAVLLGAIFGLPKQKICQGLADAKNVSGRGRIFKTDKYEVIDDAYNANPTSTKAGIDLLCKGQARLVAILGDMFELGSREEALHFEVGEYAAKAGVDLLIAIGSLSKNTRQGFDSVKTEGQQSVHYDTNEDCIADLEKRLCLGDRILVKASHSAKLEEIVAALS